MKKENINDVVTDMLMVHYQRLGVQTVPLLHQFFRLYKHLSWSAL